jgi:hypothetical protein
MHSGADSFLSNTLYHFCFRILDPEERVLTWYIIYRRRLTKLQGAVQPENPHRLEPQIDSIRQDLT